MEIGESVAISMITASKDECPMAPHDEAKGFTQAKRPEEKSVAELRSAMNAGRSTIRWRKQGGSYVEGDNTGPEQKEPGELNPPITICRETYPLSIAAHHLIPGKASLPKSKIANFIWAKGGLIKSDSGYDVDGSENGLWMPTHQVMSGAMGAKNRTVYVHENEDDPPGSKAYSWGQLSEKAREESGDTEASYAALFLPRYTQQAMFAMQTQFHDSHSDYNTQVTKRLDALSFSLGKRVSACEECGGKGLPPYPDAKPYPPAYGVVHRLNNVSHRLRNALTGMPNKKWLRLYTSNFSTMIVTQPMRRSRLRGGDY